MVENGTMGGRGGAYIPKWSNIKNIEIDRYRKGIGYYYAIYIDY